MPFGSQKYLFKKDNYEVRRNTTDEQLNALWGAIGYVGGGIAISGEVNTFAELPDAMIIPFANDALPAGAVDRWREDFTFPVATSAQGTATTVIAPVQTGVIWRITAGYYVAP